MDNIKLNFYEETMLQVGLDLDVDMLMKVYDIDMPDLGDSLMLMAGMALAGPIGAFGAMKMSDSMNSSRGQRMCELFGVPEDESAWLFHDDTLLHSGKNGVILTGRGIYTRDFTKENVFCSWETFMERTLQMNGSHILAKAENEVDLVIGYYSSPKERKFAFKLYQEMQKAMRLGPAAQTE